MQKKKSIKQKAHLFCFACRFVLPRGGGVTERARALAAVLRLLGAIVDDGAEGERKGERLGSGTADAAALTEVT